ncbi:hypothetical protein C0Q70_20056 [Pomacea canaliculata]|uniref:Uncharacterized protein n=1 Tax=Pomacea canaliculata TaxID=400727 RepID=A0A2T7NEH1_POMCA|nr:hypothetical protein C0Q70_20056 [Pomacea canaliculata]
MCRRSIPEVISSTSLHTQEPVAMRPQLRTSSEQRRRSSACLLLEPGCSPLDPLKRRGSSIANGGTSGHFLAVPDLRNRRSSLSTSTSSLLSIVEGSKKRGSFTSSSATGSLLCVPQETELRRRSLPGSLEVNSVSTSPAVWSRRRSSVSPRVSVSDVNTVGARKMKAFGFDERRGSFVFIETADELHQELALDLHKQRVNLSYQPSASRLT